MYVKVREEIKVLEYNLIVYEQGLYITEGEARDVEERFLDSLIDYWISSNQHKDVFD